MVRPIMHYFGRLEPDNEFTARFGPIIPADRIHAAFEDGEVVGSGGVFPFETGIPGGLIRAAGITSWACCPRIVAGDPPAAHAGADRRHPRARRAHGLSVGLRGRALRALRLRHRVVQRKCGDPARPRGVPRRLPAVRQVRFLEKDEAVEPFSAIQRAAAERNPGMFVRTKDWWRHRRLADPRWGREGGGEMVRALLELDGRRRMRSTGSTSRRCAGPRPASPA